MALSVAFSIPALAGCGGEARESKETAARISPDGAPRRPSRPFRRALRVHSPQTRAAVVLRPGPGSVRIEIAGPDGRLVVEGYERGSHRRYEGPEESPIAKVRTAGSAIRVASPKGVLLWRIAVAEGRIRLSRGAGDLRPYVLARLGDGPSGPRGGGRLVLRQGTEVKGRVFFADGRVRIRDGRGEVRFVGRDDRLRACYAILLLTEIPAPERAVLLAELARAEG